ncbi:hypothetical protein ACFY2W_21725 [Streptomyces sp. NPDC001262]|uniref:hypothetical protein n=1 Tax=Streptomyces sp. NPDC001262 TaxID=3364552 RepID=UPI00369002D0
MSMEAVQSDHRMTNGADSPVRVTGGAENASPRPIGKRHLGRKICRAITGAQGRSQCIRVMNGHRQQLHLHDNLHAEHARDLKEVEQPEAEHSGAMLRRTAPQSSGADFLQG